MKSLSYAARGRGFTLVEILLALGLMSLLLALAYGGLRAATRAADRGQLLLEETSRMRITHQFIRRQLNQMLPLPFDVADEGSGTRIVFEGDSHRFQFVAPMPGYLGSGGPQVQVIEVVNGGNGLDLLFSHALLQDFEQQRLYDRDPIVLLEDLEYAQFEFLSRDDDGEIMGWAASWDDPSILPLAVRIDLGFGEESQSLWPLLATTIRVDEMAVAQTAASRDYGEAIRDLIRNRKGQD